MFNVSARFLDALRSSHTAVVNVDAYVGSTLVAANLPITGGSVVVDAGSAVRRQLNLSVADLSLLPTNPDLSAPFGLEIRASRGIRFADGTTEMVPLGTFRIDVSHRAAGGIVEASGPDRAKAIMDAKFLSPSVSTLGATVVAEMTRLVQEVLATVTVTNIDVDPTLITPYLVWSSERWAAAQDLATANGAQLFFAPDGSLTMRKIPSITSPVAWFVNAGADGVLITYSKAVTREETYNGVVAMGERADGVSPARAVALDTDPASPTLWGGPFGKVPFFFTSPIITTPAGAQRAADGLLAIKRALGRSVSLTSICNPALDAGDVIGVQLPDGTLERYLVDRLTVPLDPRSPLIIEARTGSPTLVITDLPAAAPTASPYPTPATPDPYPATLPFPLAPAPLPSPFPIPFEPTLGVPGAGIPGQPLPSNLTPTVPYVSDFPPYSAPYVSNVPPPPPPPRKIVVSRTVQISPGWHITFSSPLPFGTGNLVVTVSAPPNNTGTSFSLRGTGTGANHPSFVGAHADNIGSNVIPQHASARTSTVFVGGVDSTVANPAFGVNSSYYGSGAEILEMYITDNGAPGYPLVPMTSGDDTFTPDVQPMLSDPPVQVREAGVLIALPADGSPGAYSVDYTVGAITLTGAPAGFFNNGDVAEITYFVAGA